MRFSEFKNVNETFTDIKQATDMLSLLTNPFGSVLSGDAADTSGKSSTSSGKDSGGKYAQVGKDIHIIGSKNSINWKDVSRYLSGKMDDNHRIGMLANIQGESGFVPGAIGDKKTSGGLFQHHADRFAGLRGKLGNNWASDWKGQIDYALSEPAGREYLSMRFKSPDEATAWWVRHFEIPADIAGATQSRINMARQFA